MIKGEKRERDRERKKARKGNIMDIKLCRFQISQLAPVSGRPETFLALCMLIINTSDSAIGNYYIHGL